MVRSLGFLFLTHPRLAAEEAGNSEMPTGTNKSPLSAARDQEKEPGKTENFQTPTAPLQPHPPTTAKAECGAEDPLPPRLKL